MIAEDLKHQLREILIQDLNLEDVTPEDIDDTAPLFGEGLGLDSIDAVELVVIIQRRFGVVIQDMEEGRHAFESLNSLVSFIADRATK